MSEPDRLVPLQVPGYYYYGGGGADGSLVVLDAAGDTLLPGGRYTVLEECSEEDAREAALAWQRAF